MNGTWIFQIVLVLVPAILSASLGYLLGVKQQKKQALREHITEVVRKEYPELFREIKGNLELLDNYLEEPNINFNFHALDQIYNSGYDQFVERHHKDLFLVLDSFKEKIIPRFYELSALFLDLWNKMFPVWSENLRISLPKEAVGESRNIAHDLSKSINPYYVLPDLLNGRNQKVRDKMEACILDRTSHIYREKAKRPFVIKGQSTIINFDEISNSLIEKAKPDVTNVIEAYKEVKELTDKEVKEKLLPLLQKYISNPI